MNNGFLLKKMATTILMGFVAATAATAASAQVGSDQSQSAPAAMAATSSVASIAAPAGGQADPAAPHAAQITQAASSSGKSNPEVVAESTVPAEATADAATERPALTSNLTADKAKMIEEFLEQNKELDRLEHEEKLLKLKNSVAKLELETTKAQKDRERVLHGEMPAEKSSKDFEPSSFSQQPPAGFQSQSAKPAHHDVDLPPLEQVYVTRIYGLDSDLRATVYMKGAIVQASQGDEIAEGVRLVKILKNGAIFSHKGKTKRVTMTTSFNAYSKSFETQKEDDKEEGSAPKMATPIMIGAPAGL